MHNWNLAAGDPLTLTLAADARLAATNYSDDQIWELSLGGGEPAALALQTTYGLRAHWLRLFPRFVRGDAARTDPASFHAPPRIISIYPNTLVVNFAPFDGLDVVVEYRVAESNRVTGRINVRTNAYFHRISAWSGLAYSTNRPPGRDGRSAHRANHSLQGETSYLNLAVFMTGGPQPSGGPYPALSIDLELYPGNWRQFTWAAAATRSAESALDAARNATARVWEAEQARVEMLGVSQEIQIETGNRDWDITFALAQKGAGELLMKNAPELPYPSFVLSRRPDHGFSLRGDGSDQTYLWNGQTR